MQSVAKYLKCNFHVSLPVCIFKNVLLEDTSYQIQLWHFIAMTTSCLVHIGLKISSCSTQVAAPVLPGLIASVAIKHIIELGFQEQAWATYLVLLQSGDLWLGIVTHLPFFCSHDPCSIFKTVGSIIHADNVLCP